MDVSVFCSITLLDNQTWPSFVDAECFMTNNPNGEVLYLYIRPPDIGQLLTVSFDPRQMRFLRVELDTIAALVCSDLGDNRVALSSNGSIFPEVNVLIIEGCFEESSAFNFTRSFPSLIVIGLRYIISD